MQTYELLSGERLDISTLSHEELSYLENLNSKISQGKDYFELLREVKGRDALPTRGGPITSEIVRSVLYRVASDVVDRVGIDQGVLLDPKVENLPQNDYLELLSLTEAANAIGISRPATHQALKENRLRGIRAGNAWVVPRREVERFKKSRIAIGVVSWPVKDSIEEKGIVGDEKEYFDDEILAALNKNIK